MQKVKLSERALAGAYRIRKPSTVIFKGVTSSEDDYEEKTPDETG